MCDPGVKAAQIILQQCANTMHTWEQCCVHHYSVACALLCVQPQGNLCFWKILDHGNTLQELLIPVKVSLRGAVSLQQSMNIMVLFYLLS